MPKISIIIPVYNAERYLNQTLESVTNQTYKDIELILINDCSTDNSLGILEEFAQKDERIKIISNEQNSGAAVSRNNGLAIAQGDYLLFLDADDIYEPDLAESVLSRALPIDADVVIYNYDRTNGGKKINLKKHKFCSEEYFSPEKAAKEIFNFGPLNAFSKCFKRVFVLENGIKFQDLKSCNDVYFTMSALALAKRIVVLDKVLVHYRADAQGNISSKRGRYYKNVIIAHNAVKENLIEKNKYELYKHSLVKAFKNSIRYEYKQVTKENKKAFLDYCKKNLGTDWSMYKSITYPILIQKILNTFD